MKAWCCIFATFLSRATLAESLEIQSEIELNMKITEFINNLEPASIIVLLLFIAFLIYVLLDRKIDLQLKIIMTLIGLSLLFMINRQVDFEIKIKKVKNNYSLTTGKLTRYSFPSKGRTASPPSIEYNYIVNDRFYQNSYQENYLIEIPDYKPNTDVEYLVIYEKSNIENSFLLFNYPIMNSSDFENFKKQLEKGIPSNTFK